MNRNYRDCLNGAHSDVLVCHWQNMADTENDVCVSLLEEPIMLGAALIDFAFILFCVWLQIPCEHVFCLTCAKLDPTCFL